MSDLLVAFRKTFPDISFVAADSFYWSPRKRVIHYDESSLREEPGRWSLLHEAGHALLDHQTYSTDFDLLKIEVSAWEKAKVLGKKHGHQIDENHIEDCLDTYRDWLYLRSTCPSCMNSSQQINSTTYRCFNCNSEWTVSASRKCRSYRKKKA